MMNKNAGEMAHEMERLKELTDRRLATFFTERYSYMPLLESMRYSLLEGGKRIRAVICMKFCEAVGGKTTDALDAACAIEMMHAYTLIHDDLPCMDDDDMRRGKPSNHIKYGESTAVLAGDALQAAAFTTLLGTCADAKRVVNMVRILAEAAGAYGVCGGQYLDLSDEGELQTPDKLMEIYRLKTAVLISAAARLGVIAGGGTQTQIDAADEYAQAIGLAFQLRDDILDDMAPGAETGKPAGSDGERDKTTAVSLLGAGECERIIGITTEKAISAIIGKFGDTAFLSWLASFLSERKT